MSSSKFTHTFDTPVFKGTVSLNTGLFIGGKWVDSKEGKEIDVINPATGALITKIAAGSPADVDAAVHAARAAFEGPWGLHTPGIERSRLLFRLADLMEQHAEQLAALEALDNGKTFAWAKGGDVAASIETFRYYAGWAGKKQGDVIETTEAKLAYTRHEPIGVVGQIIPWNFPLAMLSWKFGPALATGNAIVLKPSELTPLSALYLCDLITEAGFPPGVVNVVNGYGNIVGQAIAEHTGIDKVAFTGSTLVGRKIMEAAAKTNLKNVTLELGGKSPTIVFDDCDLPQAVAWAAHGIFFNHGQSCSAGSRVFVHAKIYDEFMRLFQERARKIRLGDPFGAETDQGPQVSQGQFDRIMSYIDSGKEQGATLALGGQRHGTTGYFIEPTVFTNTKPDMRIVREEIFGPVVVVIKFEDDADVIRQANDSVYGLGASVFSQDITRAINTAHALHAGSAWINCANQTHPQIPFGGYKQSGIGRELGEYALANYCNVKSVHVNLGHTM